MRPWLVTVGYRARAAPRPVARVVALPHAGGWPSAFRTWRRVLPEHVELVVAQLPGRGVRSGEEPLRRVGPVVDELAAALLAAAPLPTVVLGHSFGAVLGYELARRLEGAGRPPELVVTSARQPPCFPSLPPFAHRGTDEELLAHLVRIGGVSPEVLRRPALVGTALDAIRADLEALETYRRPPSGTAVPVLALAAVDDPVVVADRMHLWSVETTGAFRLRLFTGGHFYLYDPAVAASVATDLLAALPDPARHSGGAVLGRSA